MASDLERKARELLDREGVDWSGLTTPRDAAIDAIVSALRAGPAAAGALDSAPEQRAAPTALYGPHGSVAFTADGRTAVKKNCPPPSWMFPEDGDQDGKQEVPAIVEQSAMSRHTRAMLLNVIWHHQGGGSRVGQPLRAMLGIGQHDRLSDEQLAEAKWIEGLLVAGDHEPAEQQGGGDVVIEGLRLADQFFDGQDDYWQWDDGECFPGSKVREALQAAIAARQPEGQAVPILSADHDGMRVSYSGLIRQACGALARGVKEPGIAEMLCQLREHLAELGRRWYSGDAAVVDEMLQLYCIEPVARATVKAAQPQGEAVGRG